HARRQRIVAGDLAVGAPYRGVGKKCDREYGKAQYPGLHVSLQSRRGNPLIVTWLGTNGTSAILSTIEQGLGIGGLNCSLFRASQGDVPDVEVVFCGKLHPQLLLPTSDSPPRRVDTLTKSQIFSDASRWLL